MAEHKIIENITVVPMTADGLDDCWEILEQPFYLKRILHDHVDIGRVRQVFYFNNQYRPGLIFKRDGEVVGFVGWESVGPAPNAICLHGGVIKDMLGDPVVPYCVRYMLDYLFNHLNIQKIELMEVVPNILIARFARDYGFRLEGEISNRVVCRGKAFPIKFYGMTKEMWNGLR